MSDKNKTIDNASSKSSDASKQPSQVCTSGSTMQNPQPQGNVQPTTNGTNTTQTAVGQIGNLPIKPDEGSWNPLTQGRALKESDTPIDPTDERYIHISDDEGKESK
ncbi:hypothetical protein FVEN_g1751 [Fusarium venenatum]|uniref:Uncharacterized protein n=1 Tax=Fusarium venenatum TaxID=56646 RepID=A0A2L2SSV7_9HYPO|nr:uncharacterized protein FVRRES_13012 [Fusarium venenatum]KAG8360681.1 hypothetical protein FVEN_g1751 [Fusarium venenatum]KAH6979582.1 hypothetical protein EDB82DRAFT_261707 [Fusarium venenatum]CEI40321.1 unnamed protein product [Fusarium venenatum]